MANSPDIVLGVAGAADAERQREAIARLQDLSRQAASKAVEAAKTGEAADAWEALVRQATADATQGSGPQLQASIKDVAASRTSTGIDTSNGKNPYVQFEALMLQKMVEEMMPQDSEAVFGSGTAGKIWKSMMAEHIATEIAETGALGIAKQIAAGEAARIGAQTPATTKADDV